ncbi:hypothetical protein [Kerstersia gyiorum]|nr:hypothetical protein [Kerstersia gyiorum]
MRFRPVGDGKGDVVPTCAQLMAILGAQEFLENIISNQLFHIANQIDLI